MVCFIWHDCFNLNPSNIRRKRSETNLQLQDDIIYGPVYSRRLGWSLGVNILGTKQKLCSMNCLYCQYGWTSRPSHDLNPEDIPGPEQIFHKLHASLAECSNPIDYVTIAGNGEPTLHPGFAEIVDGVVRILHDLRPQTKLAMLSNGLHCNEPAIRDALERVDLPIVKLDAGTEKTFQRLNNPANGFTFADTVTGLERLDRCILQTMFVDGILDNTKEEELTGLVKLMKRIRPLHIQIYSIDREPASSKVKKVDSRKLQELGSFIKEETGIETSVY